MTRLASTDPRLCAKEAGFSLIELLVSLTLLAMVLALLPGAFKTGKRGWETAAMLEQRDVAAVSIEFLRHRIAEALVMFDRAESGLSRLAFTGSPQDLSFVAPAPSGPLGGGLYRFTVVSVADGSSGGSALAVRMSPFRPQGSRPAVPPIEHRLVSGIGALRLRYFGVNTDGSAAAWSDAWQRTDALPALIELEGVPDQLGARGFGPVRVELKMRAPVPE